METDYVVEADPYGLEIDAMDSLQPGDVMVHSTLGLFHGATPDQRLAHIRALRVRCPAICKAGWGSMP